MSSSEYSRMLRDYHERLVLPERSEAALERMADLLAPRAEISDSKRIVPVAQRLHFTACVGWAAAIVLGAFSVWTYRSLGESQQSIVELRRQVAIDKAQFAAVKKQAENPWPRFVALRLASADCPYCEKTHALFDELERDHAARGVYFATVDPASPEGKAELAKLFRNLKIDWASSACQQCCAVRLLDRKEQRVAASQVALLPQDEFRAQFAKLVSESAQ